MEEWREIPGFVDCLASNSGLIRGARGRLLKGSVSKGGYLYVRVKTSTGESKKMHVHWLVSRAFIGERPPGYTVNHIDGVKQNNASSNLEYVTNSENIKHAHRNGLVPYRRGEQANRARFAFSDVCEMRRLRDGGLKLQDIAEKFDTNKGYVSELVRKIHRADC